MISAGAGPSGGQCYPALRNSLAGINALGFVVFWAGYLLFFRLALTVPITIL